MKDSPTRRQWTCGPEIHTDGYGPDVTILDDVRCPYFALRIIPCLNVALLRLTNFLVGTPLYQESTIILEL